jgi:hypothetical protein
MYCRYCTARGQSTAYWLWPVAIVLVTMVFISCTYQVLLIPRDDGEPGRTSKVWIDSFGECVSGSIDLIADGVRYSGTYVSSPSDYGLTILKQHGPKHGELVQETSAWYGQAFLQGPDARTLRCEYKGSWSRGGYGVCISNEGKVYDMHITP